MDNVRLDDATRNIGESQGFLNVSIRDEVQNLPGHGRVCVMVTKWKPDARELAALARGETITLELWGVQWPPMMLYVGDPVPEVQGVG